MALAQTVNNTLQCFVLHGAPGVPLLSDNERASHTLADHHGRAPHPHRLT
jgi:hypothetical protein